MADGKAAHLRSAINPSFGVNSDFMSLIHFFFFLQPDSTGFQAVS